MATTGASADRDTIVSLFVGRRGDCFGRFLDQCDARTGAYQYSLLLPERLSQRRASAASSTC
jgi:hypothetical protein